MIGKRVVFLVPQGKGVKSVECQGNIVDKVQQAQYSAGTKDCYLILDDEKKFHVVEVSSLVRDITKYIYENEIPSIING